MQQSKRKTWTSALSGIGKAVAVKAGYGVASAGAVAGMQAIKKAYRNSGKAPTVKQMKTTVKKAVNQRKKINKVVNKVKYDSSTRGKIDDLYKKVKKLSSKVSKTTLTYKSIEDWRPAGTINLVQVADVGTFGVSKIETALAQLKYFDEQDPSALDTVSGATGTYQRAYQCSVYGKVIARNNGSVPADFGLYCMIPKVDHVVNASTGYAGGLADSSNGNETNILCKFSDSPMLNKYWKVAKKKVVHNMAPGSQIELSYSSPSFVYDPSFTDTHTDEYQKRLYGYNFVTRTQGVLGHQQNSSTKIGLITSAVDVSHQQNIKISYDGGYDGQYTYVNMGFQMTGPTGVCGNYRVTGGVNKWNPDVIF